MWLKQPEKDLPKSTIPLLRAAPGKTIEANLTGWPLRLYVHFAARRSWPCTGRDCGLCKRGITKRYYAYYPVAGREENVGMIELTGRVEEELMKQMGPDNVEPSGHISLYRPGGRRNMPCTVAWSIEDKRKQSGGGSKENQKQSAGGTLTSKEMKDALMRIWKLPSFNGTLTENEYLAKLDAAIALQTKTHG